MSPVMFRFLLRTSQHGLLRWPSRSLLTPKLYTGTLHALGVVLKCTSLLHAPYSVKGTAESTRGKDRRKRGRGMGSSMVTRPPTRLYTLPIIPVSHMPVIQAEITRGEPGAEITSITTHIVTRSRIAWERGRREKTYFSAQYCTDYQNVRLCCTLVLFTVPLMRTLISFLSSVASPSSSARYRSVFFLTHVA